MVVGTLLSVMLHVTSAAIIGIAFANILSSNIGAAITEYSYADSCTTPDGAQGQCVPSSSCIDDIRLVKDQCGKLNRQSLICCAKTQIQHNSKVMAMFQNATFDCGTLVARRVAHGHEVQLSSRPWMALLKYNHEGGPRFLCGGTLIAERYVLTAAHCVYGRENELFEVRLGEHKLSTDTDCVRFGRHLKCAPPVQDVGIEKHLLHVQFNTIGLINDIALLRLKSAVRFEKHIKPICLPLTKQIEQQADNRESFLITGWGTTEKNAASDVLQEIKVERTSLARCSQEFTVQRTCYDGDALQESCKGDSGGPVIKKVEYFQYVRFVQYGIVSAGGRRCGKFNGVDLSTNVAAYVQWITDIMFAHGL